jgi:hypothetical protein
VTPTLRRRIGFEIELMAPAGRSRRSLAYDLAGRHGGRIRPVWHQDSEPSLVPGLGRFLHLTQGFEVIRPPGQPSDRSRAAGGAVGWGSPMCTLVDDITLLDDLDPRTPPPPGWYRILSDDARLLSLLSARCDASAPLREVLDPVAALWGTAIEEIGDVVRLDDPSGATVALAAPQGAERERPCEIVTPPISKNHHESLEELLEPARDLGFTVPHEAAVHLHFDGAPFRQPYALANVIRLFAHWREPLRQLLRTNPACRRLAALPDELVAAAEDPTLDGLRKAADASELTKYFDVNLTQLFKARPLRDTLEIRILPGAIDADPIINQAALVELLLDRCLDPEPFPAAPAGGVSGLMEIAAESLAQR